MKFLGIIKQTVDQPAVVAAFSYKSPILSTMKKDSFFLKLNIPKQ
jgi:hypothetical protein